MQPYFLPYIGYWQLINASDTFVIYDNIQFTKNSWIRRNRMLVNGEPCYFVLPLQKGSDYLDVSERFLSASYESDRIKLISRIKATYRNAPFFESVFPVIRDCICYDNNNLFMFILNSVHEIMDFLDMKTKVVVSSHIDDDRELKGKDRVLYICKGLKAKTYLNPIGGTRLYDKSGFESEGIDLGFVKTREIFYKQFTGAFVENLSILDVLMFNSVDTTKAYLSQFELV